MSLDGPASLEANIMKVATPTVHPGQPWGLHEAAHRHAINSQFLSAGSAEAAATVTMLRSAGAIDQACALDLLSEVNSRVTKEESPFGKLLRGKVQF